MWNNIIKRVNKDVFIIFVLIILAFPLRFIDLGYSDYIGDEPKAFIQPEPNQTHWDFFMTQRKGPLQFIISLIPYLITNDYRNELAQRIPFAIISVLSVACFYLMLQKMINNRFISFFSSTLFLLNGFIVGFGRIAQYQNLNLLFSFLSIYFYASLLEDNAKLYIRHTLLGTLFFCLSLLSHWDAIFILPLILYIFISYLRKKSINFEDKKALLIKNFLLGCLVLLPFLIPYVFNQSTSSDNMEYFSRRVSSGYFNKETYEVLIKLYNPFITLPFILVTSCIGLLGIKKNYPFVLWFLYSYGIFELFVRKPGTHIYNFVLPALVLSSFGVFYIFKIFPKYLKVFPALAIMPVIVFLYYQSYVIFVDHRIEYPWSSKTLLSIKIQQKAHNKPTNREIPLIKREVLNFTTPEYSIDQKLPLFGFPHKRYWNEINAWINEQNIENNESFGYVTNEVKTISEWYMDAKYKAGSGFYAVGIYKPLSFVDDWNLTNIGGKELVRTIKNDDNRTIVKIYRVD